MLETVMPVFLLFHCQFEFLKEFPPACVTKALSSPSLFFFLASLLIFLKVCDRVW